MYFCDSRRREIMQAAYDAAAATVSSIELFADVSGLRGDPDGSIVDANGGLWNAVWGAGVIRRFTPGGLLDRQVPVPAKQPTCVAFGGNDLDILAVTSARQGLTDEELATEPLSGGVFAVTAIGAPGLEDTRFDDDTATGVNASERSSVRVGDSRSGPRVVRSGTSAECRRGTTWSCTARRQRA